MTTSVPGTDGLRSPNTVLANAVDSTLDVLRPRIHAEKPDTIRFTVGTQINGHPHIGTHLVQSLAFLIAERARDDYGIDVDVEFHALDNAPAATVREATSGYRYQRTYLHQLGPDAIRDVIAEHYTPLFAALSLRTGVRYTLTTYTEQQNSPEFRAEFIRTLEHLDDIRFWLDPSAGSAHIRLPCPGCGWAEKYAERTRLLELDDSGALFESVCLHHGRYESDVTPLGGGYVDLSTLYRNVVKERSYRPDGTLRVMVKGATGRSAVCWWMGHSPPLALPSPLPCASSLPRSSVLTGASSVRACSVRPRPSPAGAPCSGGFSTLRCGQEPPRTMWRR